MRFECGTISATGGSSSTGVTGSGAGSGGGTSSGINQAGGGSLSGSSQLDGGTITAVGGAMTSGSGTSYAGAGAGFGGGGSGGGTNNDVGFGYYLASFGGTLSVTPGVAAGETLNSSSDHDASGFGPGGGFYEQASNAGIDFDSGTTTFSGEVNDGIDLDQGATLSVPASSTLELNGASGNLDDSVIGGTLKLPTSSTLLIDGLEKASLATETLQGTVDLQNATMDVDEGDSVTLQSPLIENSSNELTSSIVDVGVLTLAGGGTLDGSVLLQSDDSSHPAALDIPASQTAQLGSGDIITVDSNCTINLAGQLAGSGSVQNQGAIILTASGSIPGNGVGSGEVSITGQIFHVDFSSPLGTTAPASQWVYADTLADGGESLPAEPAYTNYSPTGWESTNGGTVTNTTALEPLATGGTVEVPLTAEYQYSGGGSGSGTATSTLGQPDPNSVSVGSAVIDNVTISGAAAGHAPTGTVRFYVCGPLGSSAGCTSTAVAVGDGSPQSVQPNQSNDTGADSSQSFTPTVAGTYCFYAVYSGDAYNAGSSDGTADNCFSAGIPTVKITTPTASANPALQADVLTLTTTVTPTSGSGVVNEGQVAFLLNGTTTICVAEVISGKASCETPTLPAGNDKITARFEGTTNYGPSAVSAALTETIKALSAFSASSTATSKGVTRDLRTAILLPFAGQVRIVATGARRSISRSERVTAKRVTLELGIRSIVTALKRQAPRATHATIRLTVTFTPKTGAARTVTQRVRATLRVR